MTTAITTCFGILGLTLTASCALTSEPTTRIDVAESNALGVATLETERTVDQGNDVFTLRALGADDHSIASVRLTVGTISDLARWAPGASDEGSEIVVSVGGRDRHVFSRETSQFTLSPSTFHDPSIAELLELAAVSTTLERAAHIAVARHAVLDPIGPESPYVWLANACAPAYLLTTPLGRQCCHFRVTETNYVLVTIVNPAEAIVVRQRNPNNGTACKASDGSSSCSGTACYYGPNGFTRATITSPSAEDPYGFVDRFAEDGYGYDCIGYHVASPPTPDFSDITGTFPTSQGCPGGNTGDGDWDY